jgi:SAM-dependent methyltransferase
MFMTERELNGDANLGLNDRLRYLAGNLRRNLRPRRASLEVSRWPAPDRLRRHAAPGASSPLRVLSEAFIRDELPRQRPPGEVAVLDIGCGSGRLAALLAEAGYRGRYTGVDAADRFAADAFTGPDFRMTFAHGDAHDARLDGPFDLVCSVSALEHIAEDGRLLDRLEGMLSPAGLQVHIVPAPAALLLYLWHGYRQYGVAALADRFGARGARVFALGGAASWLLHFLWITLPETVLRARLRRAFPRSYAALLRLALRLDARLPSCPLGYAVVSPRRDADRDREAMRSTQ